MREAHDLADTFQEAFDLYKMDMENARREWASRLLRDFPDKARLRIIAERTRRDLAAMAVEVNSLGDKVQTTIAKAPGSPETVFPLNETLCVLGIATKSPLQVSDIQGDPFLAGHNARRLELTSWASAPIVIEDIEAGSVCALETVQARIWSDAEERKLQDAADEIGDVIHSWFLKADKQLFL